MSTNITIERGVAWFEDGTEVSNVSARAIKALPALLRAAKCALADLEGIMPEFEPSGDRTHPAWETIKELADAIRKAEGEDQ